MPADLRRRLVGRAADDDVHQVVRRRRRQLALLLRHGGQLLDVTIGIVNCTVPVDNVGVDPPPVTVDLHNHLLLWAARMQRARTADIGQRAVVHLRDHRVDDIHPRIEIVHQRQHTDPPQPRHMKHQRHRMGRLLMALAAARALRIAVDIAGAGNLVLVQVIVDAVIAPVQRDDAGGEHVVDITYPAQPSRGDHLLYSQHMGVVVPGVADDQLASAIVAGFGQMTGVRREQRHRLFQDHMQPVFKAGARGLVMGGVPGRDHDAVQLLLRQHLVNVGIGPFHAKMPGRFVQYIRADIGQGDEVGVRVGLQRGNVSGRGPPSCSDDGDSGCVEYGSPLTFLFRLRVPRS